MTTNLRPLFQSMNPHMKTTYNFSRYMWIGDNHFEVYVEAKINKPTTNPHNGEIEHNIDIEYFSFVDTDSGAEFDIDFQSNSVEELEAFKKLYIEAEETIYRYIINHRTEITDGY